MKKEEKNSFCGAPGAAPRGLAPKHVKEERYSYVVPPSSHKLEGCKIAKVLPSGISSQIKKPSASPLSSYGVTTAWKCRAEKQEMLNRLRETKKAGSRAKKEKGAEDTGLLKHVKKLPRKKRRRRKRRKTPSSSTSRRTRRRGTTAAQHAARRATMMREVRLSSLLRDVVVSVHPELGNVEGGTGEVRMSRPQVTKSIWQYAKERGLRMDPDGRTVWCDEKLRALFAGRERVNLFSELQSLLVPHLLFYEEGDCMDQTQEERRNSVIDVDEGESDLSASAFSSGDGDGDTTRNGRRGKCGAGRGEGGDSDGSSSSSDGRSRRSSSSSTDSSRGDSTGSSSSSSSESDDVPVSGQEKRGLRREGREENRNKNRETDRRLRADPDSPASGRVARHDGPAHDRDSECVGEGDGARRRRLLRSDSSSSEDDAGQCPSHSTRRQLGAPSRAGDETLPEAQKRGTAHTRGHERREEARAEAPRGEASPAAGGSNGGTERLATQATCSSSFVQSSSSSSSSPPTSAGGWPRTFNRSSLHRGRSTGLAEPEASGVPSATSSSCGPVEGFPSLGREADAEERRRRIRLAVAAAVESGVEGGRPERRARESGSSGQRSCPHHTTGERSREAEPGRRRRESQAFTIPPLPPRAGEEEQRSRRIYETGPGLRSIFSGENLLRSTEPVEARRTNEVTESERRRNREDRRKSGVSRTKAPSEGPPGTGERRDDDRKRSREVEEREGKRTSPGGATDRRYTEERERQGKRTRASGMDEGPSGRTGFPRAAWDTEEADSIQANGDTMRETASAGEARHRGETKRGKGRSVPSQPSSGDEGSDEALLFPKQERVAETGVARAPASSISSPSLSLCVISQSSAGVCLELTHISQSSVTPSFECRPSRRVATAFVEGRLAFRLQFFSFSSPLKPEKDMKAEEHQTAGDASPIHQLKSRTGASAGNAPTLPGAVGYHMALSPSPPPSSDGSSRSSGPSSPVPPGHESSPRVSSVGPTCGLVKQETGEPEGLWEQSTSESCETEKPGVSPPGSFAPLTSSEEQSKAWGKRTPTECPRVEPRKSATVGGRLLMGVKAEQRLIPLSGSSALYPVFSLLCAGSCVPGSDSSQTCSAAFVSASRFSPRQPTASPKTQRAEEGSVIYLPVTVTLDRAPDSRRFRLRGACPVEGLDPSLRYRFVLQALKRSRPASSAAGESQGRKENRRQGDVAREPLHLPNQDVFHRGPDVLSPSSSYSSSTSDAGSFPVSVYDVADAVLMQRSDPERWNASEVSLFLQSLRVPGLAAACEACELDGRGLLELQTEDLESFGVQVPLLRRRVLDAIRSLQKRPTPSASAEDGVDEGREGEGRRDRGGTKSANVVPQAHERSGASSGMQSKTQQQLSSGPPASFCSRVPDTASQGAFSSVGRREEAFSSCSEPSCGPDSFPPNVKVEPSALSEEPVRPRRVKKEA